MIAFVCRHYGYLMEAVLKMPFQRMLFLMRQARVIEIQGLIDQCDIQAIAITSSEYYYSVRSRFENTLMMLNSNHTVSTTTETRKPIAHAVDNTEARDAMFHAARALKESSGYGAR